VDAPATKELNSPTALDFRTSPATTNTGTFPSNGQVATRTMESRKTAESDTGYQSSSAIPVHSASPFELGTEVFRHSLRASGN